MASESTFLNLPRELRDAIYVHYVSLADGYVFDWETGKLRAAAASTSANAGSGASNAKASCPNLPTPIDLNLAYTCKQVADELRGVALRSNVITFSTLGSDDVRIRAARFRFLRLGISAKATAMLYYRDETNGIGRPCFTPLVAEQAARSYPMIRQALQDFFGPTPFARKHASTHLYDRWGCVHSVQRQAIKHTLQLAIDQGCFATGKGALRPHANCTPQQLLALDSAFPPWHIPTDDDLKRLAVIMPPNSPHREHTAEYWMHPHFDAQGYRQYTQGRYRFSAAAVAIKFLRALPYELRMHLRQIRLLEDHVAVAYPETHAMGLIEYCIENPSLRIERRVDIWRTVFLSEHDNSLFSTVFRRSDDLWVLRLDSGGLAAMDATECLGIWMLEAMALIPAGMPKHSFSLVLDAGPEPERASEIFRDAVQPNAALQAAWEMFVDLEATNLNIDDYDRRTWPYLYDGFPQVIKEVINKTSPLIICTFDPASPLWDTKWELQRRRKEFENSLNRVLGIHSVFAIKETDVEFDTPPSLPSWNDLRAEEVMPDFFQDFDLDQHRPPSPDHTRPIGDDIDGPSGGEIFFT